MKEDQVNSD